MLIIAVITVPILVVTTVLVVGTLLYEVPFLGLSSVVVSRFSPWLIAVSAAGTLLALWLARQRRSRLRMALVALGALSALGASVITGRMVAAVERAGANVNLVQAFGVGVPASGSPDAEVAYSSYQGEDLKLNIYQPSPSRSQALAPVLVFIHGGGWISGSRSDHSADMRWFADQGWLTISLDYTLSSDDRHLWDITQGQVGCAMSWVGQNAQQYGGDPARLSLTGDSAGGNLAINTAYLTAQGALPSACGGDAPQVAAVSTLYPVVDPVSFYNNDDAPLGDLIHSMSGSYTGGSPQEFPDRYTAIASATHLSAAAPPTLMIVGEADHIVPPESAYSFAEQAEVDGVAVKLVRVPYGDHVFDGAAGSIGQQAYRQLTVQWLSEHGQAP